MIESYEPDLILDIKGKFKDLKDAEYIFTKDYEIVQHSGCSSVVYADKKAFDYVIRWIECNVCMFVSFA